MRRQLLTACLLVLFAFLGLFLVGQTVSTDPTLEVPTLAERLYPGTWPPVARGFLWLIAGAAAVGFDLFVVRPIVETRRGEIMVVVSAVITGGSFLAFAIASFLGAAWTVIH